MPIANCQFLLISADICVANCLESINLVKCQLSNDNQRENHCNDNWKCQLFKRIIREGHCIYVQSVSAGGKSFVQPFTHSCQRRCPSLWELCTVQCARTLSARAVHCTVCKNPFCKNCALHSVQEPSLCKNCARILSLQEQLCNLHHFWWWDEQACLNMESETNGNFSPVWASVS